MRIRKLRLWIFVQALHIGMRRRGVEVVIILFDVFAVIPLIASQAEQALFQDRIPAIPKRKGQTQALVIVGDAGDTILGPAVSARAGMIVWEIVPCRSIAAVVFARIAPGALRQVGSPALPMFLAAFRLQKAIAFSVHLFYRTTCGRGETRRPVARTRWSLLSGSIIAGSWRGWLEYSYAVRRWGSCAEQPQARFWPSPFAPSASGIRRSGN